MNLDSGTREYLAEVLEESTLELANISMETHTDRDSDKALQQAIQTELQGLYEAAEFCSFEELRHIVSWMQANLQLLQQESEQLQHYNTAGDFYLWIELLAIALNERDPHIQLELLSALQAALQAETWLLPIEPLALQGLLDTLSIESHELGHPSLTQLDNTEEPYDLSWDDDVHPELLEAFLLETPAQVLHVSDLIRQISTGGSDAAMCQTAARLAHTIKGSSAVIGLTAVATLTQHLENILEYSVEQKLPDLVAQLLIEVTHCLEALFESLLTEGIPPVIYPTLLAQLSQCSSHIAQGNLDADSVATFIAPRDQSSTALIDHAETDHAKTDASASTPANAVTEKRL